MIAEMTDTTAFENNNGLKHNHHPPMLLLTSCFKDIHSKDKKTMSIYVMALNLQNRGLVKLAGLSVKSLTRLILFGGENRSIQLNSPPCHKLHTL